MANTERAPDDAVQRSRDVDLRGVMLTGFWLAVGTIASAVFIGALLWFLGRSPNRADKTLSPLVAANLQRTPPEPRLEANPVAPRMEMRAEEDWVLGSYGWVDEKAGMARIPIDRAMDLLAERGLPPAKPMAAAPTLPPSPGGAR
ncbi:MAG TPA: hypothetical protein VJA66_03615 [Thermoanaerobaculia bacterium]